MGTGETIVELTNCDLVLSGAGIHLLLCLCLRDFEKPVAGRIMVDPGTKFQSVSFFVPSAFSVVLLRLSLLHLFFSTTPRCKLWTG